MINESGGVIQKNKTMMTIFAATFTGGSALTFALQICALIALLMASLGKSVVWGKLQTFPLGMFFWLLSLMLTAALHTAN